MKGSQAGRVDLIRALAVDESLRDDLAEMLGFNRRPRQPKSTATKSAVAASTSRQQPAQHSDEPELTTFQPAPVEYWRVETCRLRSTEALPPPDPKPQPGVTPQRSVTRSGQRGAFQTLAPLSDLMTRLRRLAELERPGSEPDVDRLISDYSRGRIPPEMPFRPKRGLGVGLHVVQDVSSRLIPYRYDQGILSLELKDVLPKTALTLSTVSDG